MMLQLLVMNIPPELEDNMVDYLLAQTSATGFTSYPVRGHGERRQLTIAEQVTGQRKRLQFELVLETDKIEALLTGLKSDVGTDIFYWYQPIGGAGRC